MTLVGFKRAVLGIYDDYWNIIKTHVFDGKTDEGATVTAEISGLSSEPIKTYSPETSHNLLVIGNEGITVSLGILDMPFSFENELLGYQNKNNLFYGGETSNSPYANLLLESENIKGEKVLLGFFRGKIVKNDSSMQTKKNDNEELQAEFYTFYCEPNDDGDCFAKGIGDLAEGEIKKIMFPS